MSTKLTRAHFEQRIEAFYTFAREQGYLVTALGPGRSGRHHYLVQNEENVVEVSLTSMVNFPVSTEQGIRNVFKLMDTY